MKCLFYKKGSNKIFYIVNICLFKMTLIIYENLNGVIKRQFKGEQLRSPWLLRYRIKTF